MEQCTTLDNKNTPSPKQSCVFPFSYKGVTYEECTSDETEYFWCGTESIVTDEVGWGYCNDACFNERNEHNEKRGKKEKRTGTEQGEKKTKKHT